MKFVRWLVFAAAFLVFACQPTTLPIVIIIDNDQIMTLQTNERVPSVLLNQAGITFIPNDRVLLNGLPVSPDEPFTNYPIIIQIRRAIPITIITPDPYGE